MFELKWRKPGAVSSKTVLTTLVLLVLLHKSVLETRLVLLQKAKNTYIYVQFVYSLYQVHCACTLNNDKVEGLIVNVRHFFTCNASVISYNLTDLGRFSLMETAGERKQRKRRGAKRRREIFQISGRTERKRERKYKNAKR